MPTQYLLDYYGDLIPLQHMNKIHSIYNNTTINLKLKTSQRTILKAFAGSKSQSTLFAFTVVDEKYIYKNQKGLVIGLDSKSLGVISDEKPNIAARIRLHFYISEQRKFAQFTSRQTNL